MTEEEPPSKLGPNLGTIIGGFLAAVAWIIVGSVIIVFAILANTSRKESYSPR